MVHHSRRQTQSALPLPARSESIRTTRVKLSFKRWQKALLCILFQHYQTNVNGYSSRVDIFKIFQFANLTKALDLFNLYLIYAPLCTYSTLKTKVVTGQFIRILIFCLWTLMKTLNMKMNAKLLEIETQKSHIFCQKIQHQLVHQEETILVSRHAKFQLLSHPEQWLWSRSRWGGGLESKGEEHWSQVN